MADKKGLILNEDSSHYFVARYGQKLDRETVASFVDQYAGTQVERLVFNPNSQRTSYDSKVWDPIWKGYDPEGPDDQPLFASAGTARQTARQWVHTAWQLFQDGIDPYEIWLERAREHGIGAWISMRMNDVHNVEDEDSYIHGDFWRKNPQFRRIPYAFDEYMDKALDYSFPEVRDYHLKLVEEYASRWDMDGLELDWMRFGFHFRPGWEQEGRDILTEFTRQTRQILDRAEKRVGHKIQLSARVPSRPQTAIGLGMDAIKWAKEHLIDSLVVTPFWFTAETDMPVDLWRTLLEGTGVELCAGLELMLRPYPDYPLLHTNSLETVRGMATSYLHRGAGKIYLFNYMDSDTTIDDFRHYTILINEVGSLSTMEGKNRRHVVSSTDTWAVGQPRAYSLPAKVAPEHRKAFRVHIGPKPTWGTGYVFIGLESDNAALEVRCNGELCTCCGTARLPMPSPETPILKFEISYQAIKPGYNVVEVLSEENVTLNWLEISIF